MEAPRRPGTAAWRPAQPESSGAELALATTVPPDGGSTVRPEHERSARPATGPKTRAFRFGLATEAADSPLEAGAEIGGRYRVVELLGEGGMGRVYDAEALDPTLITAGFSRVAIKVLRSERASSQDLARFRQEAKAAGRVGHGSIVRVLDFAELPDGTVYLVMERLRGQSVEDWLEAPGRLRDALRWLADFARGLHAAHQAGIVHRDIKPANLFLQVDPEDRGGRPIAKILDFGIAKVVRKDATHIETQAGTLLGTPYYLAPERALGRPLDARADLYSLGVILYEVLTGWVPFEDDNFMGILAQHIKAAPLDPRQAAPERNLPAGTCALAMRLLAKEPTDRPKNGEMLAAEIEALLRSEGAAIDTVTTGPRGAAGASHATMHLNEVAERATAVPQLGGPRGPRGTTRMEMSVPKPAAVATAPSAAGVVNRSESSRWPLLAIAAVVMVGIGVGIFVMRSSSTSSDASAEPSTDSAPLASVPAAAPPPTDSPAAAESEPVAAEPTEAATEALGPMPDDPPRPAEDSHESGEVADLGETESAPTTGTTSGATNAPERPRSRRPVRRPKPKAKADAPPPPDFKDDVYED